MTPEEARNAIDLRRLEIARDLLSRRAEGWSEERIEERRRMLLARLDPPKPQPQPGPQGTLNGEVEQHPVPLGGNTPGVRRHTKPLPGAE